MLYLFIISSLFLPHSVVYHAQMQQLLEYVKMYSTCSYSDKRRFKVIY